MKIHAIEIEGFWSYREHVRVDIAGSPFLVAVGSNGTGKSALVVSAVLAALYGKFPTRIDKDSITAGSDTGFVAIEFEVGGNVYRVARNHPRTGTSTASVSRRADGDWEVLVAKSVRDANAKVTEILGMDYDIAVMTWVAEQGKYGQFSAALPSARFRMLASVLDLDKYGRMHDTAKKALAEAKEEVNVADGRVQELNDSLIDDDAQSAEGARALTDAALTSEQDAAHTALDVAASALAAHQANDPHAAVTRARTALDAVRSVREERLHAAETALEQARQDRAAEPVRRDQAIARAAEVFERNIAIIDTARQNTLADIERRIADGQQQIETLDATAGALPNLKAAAAVVAATKRQAAEAAETARQAVADAEFAAVRADSDAFAAAGAVTEAREALDALVHAGDCPSCGQHISEAVAQSLRAAQEKVIAEREQTLEALRADHTAKAEALGAARIALREADTALTEAASAHQTAALDVDAAERAAESIARVREQVEAARARQAEVDAEYAGNRQKFEADRDQAIAEAHRAHDANLATITERGQVAAQAVNVHRKPTDEEIEVAAALAAAERVAQDSDAYDTKAGELTAARNAARARVTELDQEAGRRAEVARRRAEQTERITAAKAALAAAKKDVSVYSDLVSAYAPSGIPSMLLESAMADLNASINVTLAALSGGELEVRLSAVREKAGGSAESKVTVYVDTPTGTRPYEALSGGQRFRVDLAIRVGLAATVARGTGTPIETFILDEGWGSLDESGIRSTLEVLGRLAEQVNVLTVSHIDSVREAFPARIEVTAHEGTSAVQLVR